MKAAIKTEVVQIAINPQERFLIHVSRVFGGPKKVHGEPKDTLVVRPHEPRKGVFIAILRRPDQRRLVQLHARV
jgi:hypothetical protein